MENGLMLLMRDGPVRCAFSPRLTAEQYDELVPCQACCEA